MGVIGGGGGGGGRRNHKLHAGQIRFHDFALLRQAQMIRGNMPRLMTGSGDCGGGGVGGGVDSIVSSSLSLLSSSSTSSLSSFSNLANPLMKVSSMSSSPSNQYQYNQTRGFFTTRGNKFMSDLRLKVMERTANYDPTSSDLQYEFLKELNYKYPNAVISRFESLPRNGNFALDERCALEYISALGRLEARSGGGGSTTMMTMSKFDLNKLISILSFSPGVSPFTMTQLNELTTLSSSSSSSIVDEDGRKRKGLSKIQQAMATVEILSGGNIGSALGAIGGVTSSSVAGMAAAAAAARGGVGGGLPGSSVGSRFLGMGSAAAGGAASAASRLHHHPVAAGAAGAYGADPKKPLHVVIDAANAGFKAQLIKLVRNGLYVFLFFSLVGALLDDRGGITRAIGGAGSSKIVQQAEGSSIRFDDVKGVDEAKADLEEIVEYLKNPEKFTRLGGKLPRGLLLTGPPGTGKTMLAKAIAGEADVPFFFSSGSQFEEMYVGVGAKRVRDLFDAAKEKAPCIVFIDEIDAVGGSRRLKDQSALKMTLNELLVQMDGFDENNGIIVIGATNFKESLDSALLRPGRFDKHVVVPLPDVAGRKDILEMYAKKTRLDKDVDLGVLARGTPGFSGAELFNLMNQAALKASVDGLSAISMSVLEYAKDKILMGAERKSAVITAETAKCTAYHEAGHALVATLTDGAHPVHKATIMPRGNALGMITQLSEDDQTSWSLKQMLASLDVSMGGRVAEELIFGTENVTSGAMSDIAQATKIARSMITKYGFGTEVGLVYHGGVTGEDSASGQTRAKIDDEVKKLTDDAYARATELLKKHSKEHELLAQTLLEYETLTGDEVRDVILKGKKPSRPVINERGGAMGDQSIFDKENNNNNKKKNNNKGKKVTGTTTGRGGGGGGGGKGVEANGGATAAGGSGNKVGNKSEEEGEKGRGWLWWNNK